MFRTFVGVVFLTGSAFGSDLNVQGSSSTGGDASTIRGTIGGEVRFSVTGAVNDVATLRFGRPGFDPKSLTIDKLYNGLPHEIAPLERVNRVRLPDGQSRVFLRIANAFPAVNGGSVSLTRAGVPIDSDDIVLR
jgi:hypothetical protein